MSQISGGHYYGFGVGMQISIAALCFTPGMALWLPGLIERSAGMITVGGVMSAAGAAASLLFIPGLFCCGCGEVHWRGPPQTRAEQPRPRQLRLASPSGKQGGEG